MKLKYLAFIEYKTTYFCFISYIFNSSDGDINIKKLT